MELGATHLFKEIDVHVNVHLLKRKAVSACFTLQVSTYCILPLQSSVYQTLQADLMTVETYLLKPPAVSIQGTDC